jgi:hypothetical protein
MGTPHGCLRASAKVSKVLPKPLTQSKQLSKLVETPLPSKTYGAASDTIMLDSFPIYALNFLATVSGLLMPRLLCELRRRADGDSNAVMHAHLHNELRNFISLAEAV